jgi:voltage-gated sodium channel
MTLESWSMGIVRPVMEVHGWAWAFFVPFIMVATFTILNLFIGIIVSTMQELAAQGDAPAPPSPVESNAALLERMERDLAELRARLAQTPPPLTSAAPGAGFDGKQTGRELPRAR